MARGAWLFPLGADLKLLGRTLAQAFIDWLVSPDGQKAIADYKINGEQLFFSNADDPNA